MQNVHFMSTRDDWATPSELFKKLDDEFHFTVDLCADDENHLVERYYTAENDGLKADISGEVVYCNPPYGRKVGDFVKKCAMGGGTAVMLLPARTDTRWFHEYIYGKAEVRFIKGRLKFGGAANSAPFPSMIVVFRRCGNGKEQVSGI